MKIALAILVLALAGCATPQQRAAKAMERHGPYCTALGLKQGTPEWANCVEQAQASEDAMTAAIVFRR
ncbi:MAG: hypothetical protein M0Z73_05230 [Betaproteobacteria bacterium]|nr:hypothetical protein [Betaproteobacteria bacterium]